MKRVITYLIFIFALMLSVIQISQAETETKNLQTVTLSVPTMTCPLCPITVKKALEKVPGVKHVTVDFKTKTAIVSYDKEKTTTTNLLKATEDAGYKSSLKNHSLKN